MGEEGQSPNGEIPKKPEKRNPEKRSERTAWSYFGPFSSFALRISRRSDFLLPPLSGFGLPTRNAETKAVAAEAPGLRRHIQPEIGQGGIVPSFVAGAG